MKSTIIATTVATTAVLLGSFAGASIPRGGLRSSRSHANSKASIAPQAAAASASTSKPVTTSRLNSLESAFVIHEDIQMVTTQPAHVTSRGRLSIEGDHSSLHASHSLRIDGLLYFEPGDNLRRQAPITVQDELIINPATARISIEASSYHGATGVFELIHFENGHVGEFRASSIIILGLEESLAAEVICTESSLSLTIHPNPKYSSSASSQQQKQADDNEAFMFAESSEQDTHVRFYSI